jgi:formate hydrogenlyase subunit 6/NADH:ubiquinone oxidoreductase subunit I
MSELSDRERVKAGEGKGRVHFVEMRRFDAPVVVNADKCIKGCRICIDSCPVDCLAVDPATGKAHMQWDECWYSAESTVMRSRSPHIADLGSVTRGSVRIIQRVRTRRVAPK